MSGHDTMHDEQSDLAFYQFLAWLKHRRGLDWTQYRRGYLKRRTDACMSALGVRSYSEYTRVLERDPDAIEQLRNAITTNVTKFFRDPSTFEAFKRTVIPEVVASKRTAGVGLLRVWSAGCATGEEAFSIALCLIEVLGSDLSGMWVAIHATDVDEDCLRQARLGTYSSEALARVPEPLVKAFFTRQRDGNFVVGDTLRRMVRFQRLDLIHDTPLKHVDIIFCRNVLIYMSRELQARSLQAFHDSLNHGGFLVLGRTESVPADMLGELFTLVNAEERIYRKCGTEVLS